MRTAFARTIWLATILCALAAPPARAEVRILASPGGQVGPFLDLFEGVRESGERVVIDGPCLSACTLFTGLLPHDHVCVTKRAVLGFHAASYYDDARRSLVPTRTGTRLVMRLYPQEIRDWIGRHGGLTPHIIALRDHELHAMYDSCR